VRANLPGPNEKENSGHLMDNKIADENLNLNQMPPSKLSMMQRGEVCLSLLSIIWCIVFYD